MAQPSYVLVEEAGPEHRKTFTVEVRLHATKGEQRRGVCGTRPGFRPRRRRSRTRRGKLLSYLASRPQSVGAKLAAGIAFRGAALDVVDVWTQ